MCWRALFLNLSLALATPQGLLAQVSTIPVRGGEHDAYTRLVIQIPEDNTWRVTSDGPFAELLLSGPPVVFDLSQTFARIPRTRLRDLQPIETGLELSLACACEIRASEDIPQFLVIDIIGNAAGISLAPATSPRPRSRARLPDAALRTTEARRAGRDLARSLRNVQAGPDSAGALTLAQLFPQPDLSPPTVQEGAAPGGLTPRAAMIEVLAQTLARQVSSGVLESTPGFRAPDDPQGAAAESALTETANAIAHFQITDARQDSETTRGRDTTCPNPALLGFETPDDSAHALRRTQLLRRLHTEFDHIDPATVMALAQQFIFMGFGAEARLVLSMLDTPDAASAVLRQISFLVDLSPPENPDHLAGLAECGKMGVLWAFLVQPEADTPPSAHLDLLVQAVNSLPAHLRLHLGPQIVKRLVAHQLLEHARMITDALERVVQTPTPDLTLAQTSLELAAAPAERAPQIEAALSPDQSDESLIFLLKRRLNDTAPVEEELIAHAQTLLPALCGSPEGQELAQLLTLAEARNGNFAAAFDLLAGHDAGLEPALRTTVLSRLVQDAEDSDFVTLVFAQSPWNDLTLPVTTRNALEQRLRDLGFEHQAALLQAVAADTTTDPSALRSAGTSRAPVAASAATPTPERSARLNDSDDLPRLDREIQESDAELARARAAVEALRLNDDEQQRDAPTSPVSLQATPVPPEMQDDRLSVLEDLPETRPLPNAAPLTHGRAALDESAALRARLEAMLAGGDPD